MRSNSRSDRTNGELRQCLRVVIADVARRRAAGEPVDDQAVIAAHPDLMPELADRLAALSRVENARASASTGGPLEQDPDSAGDAIGLRLPGYEIIHEIHRGGQGVVYRAVQLATGRDVAIKVVRRLPFDQAIDRVRFEREVNVLARLRHPNIVTILDRGATADCRFFVMDYIDGEPLDAFNAAQPQSVHDTLRLFVGVCKAVHSAHLHGVIHRDLKPGNIRIDNAGEPHILDFGLARSTGHEAGDATMFRDVTMTGQFVGSLSWASPEQAAGPSDRIDLRTDIYSLGVILYQMLTGALPTPFEGNVPRMLTHILEREPVRPSQFRKGLDEDIDTIVLKCLAKEPERRYQSAASLAEDIERYLAHLPILARTPSTVYQIRKLIVRHKLPFALLVALGVSCLALAVGMSALYARARSAESREAQRRIEAEREAETARAIKEFLVEDLLASAKPENALGRKVTVKEVLANASERIETAFEHRPEIDASIRSTLGQVYQSLGEYRAAARHSRCAADALEALYGKADERVLRERLNLMLATTDAGRLEEGEALAQDALATSRRALGPDHELTLEIAVEAAGTYHRRSRLAEASDLLRDTVERCRRLYGDDDPRTARARNRLATVATFGTDRRTANEQSYRTMLAETRRRLGNEHPEAFRVMAELGFTLLRQRRFGEAEPLLREAHAGLTRIVGQDHAWTIRAMRNLGLLLRERGRVDESRALSLKTVAVSRRMLGNGHPVTLEEMNYLGTNLLREAKYADAVTVYQEVLEIAERAGLGEHHIVAQSLGASGYAMLVLGRYAEAEARLRSATDIYQRNAQPDPAWFLAQLVAALGAQGKTEEARPFAEELLRLRAAACAGPDADAYALNCYARELLDIMPEDLRDPENALAQAILGAERSPDSYHYNRYTVARAHEAVGQFEKAIEFVHAAIEHAPIEHSSERAQYETLLVRLLERVDGHDAAEQVYRDTLAARREHFPEGHPDVARSLFDLGALLNRNEKYAEAEPYLRESLELREALLADPASGPFRLTLACDTARTLVALGKSLTGQGRYADAEPLLLDAYDRLADGATCHVDLLPMTIRDIVALYDTRNQPELAAYYRSRLTGGSED